jgi:hypothetical protein
MGSKADVLTCLVRADVWFDSSLALWLAAGTAFYFLLWSLYRWLFSNTYIDVIRTCCGTNAEYELNTDLPDAEIVVDAKDRDNTITVYAAKEIVTMDPTWPTAKVVACQYGRILGIGQSLEDLDPWLNRTNLDPRDVVVDRTFENDVLVPGFIEQHGHPLIGGLALSLVCVAFHDTVAPYKPVIPGCKTKGEVLDRLRNEHEKRPITDGTPQEEDLMAWGYDSVAMGGHLSKTELDRIDPTGKRRIFVWDCSMHFAYCNTKMMEDRLGMDVQNGTRYKMAGIETDPTTGELTGTFLGVQVMLKYFPPVLKHVIKPSNSLKSIHYLMELARMNGITTYAELCMGSINLGLEMDLYRWFFDNDLTPLRCIVVLDARKVRRSVSPFRLPLPDARGKAAAKWIRDQQTRSSEKLIFNNGCKFFADDAFLGLTIQLRFPGYVEPSKNKGIWNMEEGPGSPFVRDILPFWKAGCRIHVHSNGDASQEALAEVVQTLQLIYPRFGHRFCLEHYGMSAVHIHRKLKNLGVNVGVNVYYALLRGQLNEARVGKDKAHAASRLKSMVDCGMVVAMHTDTPVAPPRPLEEIWFACNRLADELVVPDTQGTSGGDDSSDSKNPKTTERIPKPKPKPSKKRKMVPICPSECITPYQAMKMKTVDAAYVHGLDGILGSIETGKFADFAVLEENPLTSDKANLRDIAVVATVVGGVKRKNVSQTRMVPVPPGDTLEGQVLWLRAMNLVGTGVLARLHRWLLLKLAAWMGSVGTLEDVRRASDETAVAAATTATGSSGAAPQHRRNDPGRGHICPEELTPIVCKHAKPRQEFNFNFRCC